MLFGAPTDKKGEKGGKSSSSNTNKKTQKKLKFEIEFLKMCVMFAGFALASRRGLKSTSTAMASRGGGKPKVVAIQAWNSDDDSSGACSSVLSVLLSVFFFV